MNLRSGESSLAGLKRELQTPVCKLSFGVFRTEANMQEGMKSLSDLRERIGQAHLTDKSMPSIQHA